jgi:hypothetical protein
MAAVVVLAVLEPVQDYRLPPELITQLPWVVAAQQTTHFQTQGLRKGIIQYLALLLLPVVAAEPLLQPMELLAVPAVLAVEVVEPMLLQHGQILLEVQEIPHLLLLLKVVMAATEATRMGPMPGVAEAVPQQLALMALLVQPVTAETALLLLYLDRP